MVSVHRCAEIAPNLSAREEQVLLALCRGLHDKEVAKELGVSLGTVRVYRARIGEKLKLRGLVPWALVAWKLGLIDLEPVAQDAMARFEAARPEDRRPSAKPSRV